MGYYDTWFFRLGMVCFGAFSIVSIFKKYNFHDEKILNTVEGYTFFMILLGFLIGDPRWNPSFDFLRNLSIEISGQWVACFTGFLLLRFDLNGKVKIQNLIFFFILLFLIVSGNIRSGYFALFIFFISKIIAKINNKTLMVFIFILSFLLFEKIHESQIWLNPTNASNQFRLENIEAFFSLNKNLSDLMIGPGLHKFFNELLERNNLIGYSFLLLDKEHFGPHNFALDVLIRSGLSGACFFGYIFYLLYKNTKVKSFFLACLGSFLFTAQSGYERNCISLFIALTILFSSNKNKT